MCCPCSPTSDSFFYLPLLYTHLKVLALPEVEVGIKFSEGSPWKGKLNVYLVSKDPGTESNGGKSLVWIQILDTF